MASNTYRGNPRRGAQSYFRNCPGDRRKIKNDGSANSMGKQSFLPSENENGETRQCSAGPDGTFGTRKTPYGSSYHASNKNSYNKQSTNSYRGAYQQNSTSHSKTKQFSGKSVSDPRTPRREQSSFNSGNDSEHSKYNSQQRHSEKSYFDNRQGGDPFHHSINQVVPTYDQEKMADVPIRPPQPKCSDLQQCPTNVAHKEGGPPAGSDPLVFETYKMYMQRPDHKIGAGLFLSDINDLPPRFKGKVCAKLRLLDQMMENAEMMKSTVLSTDAYCDTTVPHKQDNRKLYEHADQRPQNEMFGNQAPRAYQNTSRNVHSQKNSGSGSLQRHNSTGYPHVTKAEDFNRNDSKRSSFGYSGGKGPAQRNVPNQYDEDKICRVTVSSEKQDVRSNLPPAFRNCEQLSPGSSVASTDSRRNYQEKKTYGYSGGCVSGSQPQRRSGFVDKSHQKESQEHFNCKTASYDHTEKEGIAASTQSNLGMQQKNARDYTYSQGQRSSQFNNNRANSKRSAVGQGRESCFKGSGAGVDRPNIQKSVQKHNEHLSVSSDGQPSQPRSQNYARKCDERLSSSSDGQLNTQNSRAPKHNERSSSSSDSHPSKPNSQNSAGKHSEHLSSSSDCQPLKPNSQNSAGKGSERLSSSSDCQPSKPNSQNSAGKGSERLSSSSDCQPSKPNSQNSAGKGSECLPFSSDDQSQSNCQNSTKQFYGQSVSEPRTPRREHSSFNSENDSEHSKFNSQKRHSEKSCFDKKLDEEPSHHSRNQDVLTYDQEKVLDVPIRPPQPKCSDLQQRPTNVAHEEGGPPARSDPLVSETYLNDIQSQSNSQNSTRKCNERLSSSSGGQPIQYSGQNSPAGKPSEHPSYSTDGQSSQNYPVRTRNERFSFSSDGSSQSSGNKRAPRILVKIKVSQDVEKLDYWKSFLEEAILHLKFEVSVHDAVTQMLGVAFSDESDARQARSILNKVRRKNRWKNDGSPYIKKVKSPSYKNLKNRSLKILNGCLRDIDKLYDRVILSHEKKVTLAKEELDSAKNGGDQDSVLAVQDKLKELEGMQDVFSRYTADVKRRMKAEVERLELGVAVISRNLLQMKKNFIRECNCLKGGLPIYAKKDVILDVVRQNQVSVLVAETGSGKSTQVVQYLLQTGVNNDGIIICTQPRKIAAVSIAEYISGQIGSPVGSTVGYEVGLVQQTSKNTKIVYMTDYVLLKKCVNNRNLEGISCIVVDEAHERSLFTDLLLGIIKKCLPNRPDIRVVITSATIDPGVFRDYFNLSGSAILAVPGRTYPVEVKWQDTDAHVGWNYLEGCVKLVREVHEKNSCGDILVFLTSPQETDDAVNLLKQTLPNHSVGTSAMLFSLHGKQDMEEQKKVFTPTPKGCRKIIFATNAAETSVTIPGIKYVIDSGMVKEKHYIAEKNRNALVVGFISKSSAEQRKGRAGRTQPGICYRVYSEQNYTRDMPKRVSPEILRINLQLALLKIMEFKIQPEDFDFVETPPKESLAAALHSLEFLGAVKDKCFTDLGRRITKLPLEPQLSKLVILGAQENVGYETSIIASIATVSGMVFFRNEENRVEADKKKVKFCKEEGDFLTFLNVFKQWYWIRREQKSQWCAENCINAKAMRIASQTVEELIKTMGKELEIYMRKRFKPPEVFKSKCQRILFECFSENVCVFSGHKKTGYLSPFEPGSFFVHPSSSLCYLDSGFHNFVIFSSVLKTSRTFLLNVTPIEESTIASAYKKGVFPYQVDMLKKLQLLPARIYPVGESILIRVILGRQGSKMREIEEQIKAFTKTDAFYVDVNVEKGEILIYIEQRHHSIVSKLMETLIQEAQCHMAKEEDIFRIAECASSCFAVSSGGIVNDILLPGEFREVIVEGYRKMPSIQGIISQLKDFGALQSFQEIEERGNPQILATYVKASDAQKAVERLQKLKHFDISSKVSYAKLSDKSLPLFRLQIMWPRFPCLGSGWISFQTVTDCIEASGILTNNSFYIGDRYIIFTPAKTSEKELHMKNLPSFVEPQDVMGALKKHLPDYLEVKNVNLARAKTHKASETEMNSIKKQLTQMFIRYTPSSKLVVDLKSPNAHEVSWTALVYFENFEDGEQALKELKDKAKIGEHKLHIRPILKSSLYCDMQIFKMVEKNLHILMTFAKQQNICAEFDIKPAPAKKSVLITFSCGDIKNLDKVRQEIRKLVGGTTLPCSDQATYSRLFSKSGEEYLKGIQQNTQTLMRTNSLRKTITIFGSEKAIASAKSLISSYLSTSNNEEVRIFNLCGKKIPSGFLKALRQKFGFRLFGLIDKFNLRAADVDFAKRKLTVKCSERTMQLVEKCLAELCHEVKKSSAKNQSSDDQESCPVCLDIITSDLYRLNHCGHAFCRQCLLLQMESKIMPLVCAKEGCERPIFVEDINKLLCGNEELKKEFCQVALKNFVSKSDSVRYCPVPDCSMVYRVSSQGAEFHCPSCENDICTRCHAFYHHGMTCDMFQKSRIDADYPLKVWMQEDSENRKLCPKCSAAIEKIDGCNHVICAQCDTHLCWLCLRTFSRGEDVYDHMPYCDDSS